MATKNYSSVSVNTVNNLSAATTGARGMQKLAQTLNQARKSIGGISNELVGVGKDDNGNKMFITVSNFMASVGCPLSAGGQVLLADIKKACADFLKDDEGRMMVCTGIPVRTKIGKKSYRVYVKKDGDFKALSVYGPAPVKDNSWNARKIVEMLAQSKFGEETRAKIEESRAEAKGYGEYFVEDELTGEYVPVTVQFAF